ncbi:MAG: signal peptidase I [Betaproteobacteria bacterium]|nr:signal peptidase I [Burkholderiales bacterium]NBX14255.1 signal peptidase I [Betaproteobacteria bacterium]
MQVLTSLVLAAFCAYAGSWYLGLQEGNFALLLLMAVVISGLYWLAERFYFLPQRVAAAEQFDADNARRHKELSKMGIAKVDATGKDARDKLLMQPWWLDWTAGLFPVILVVFLLRSFLFEPFKIPSGSMIPTLWVGDLILVNKFHYGVRLPVLNLKITQGTEVARGDVMVFRYPPRPSVDYIKRVVGVPGDEVSYLNKKLFINGQAIATENIPEFFDESVMRYFKQSQEKLGEKSHNLIVDDDRPAFIPGADDFAFRDQCRYSIEGVVCKVPQGHYFMMGDNRDNSLDSRYWGFVPDANIVGKAFFVWMNFGNLKRIGAFN